MKRLSGFEQLDLIINTAKQQQQLQQNHLQQQQQLKQQKSEKTTSSTDLGHQSLFRQMTQPQTAPQKPKQRPHSLYTETSMNKNIIIPSNKLQSDQQNASSASKSQVLTQDQETKKLESLQLPILIPLPQSLQDYFYPLEMDPVSANQKKTNMKEQDDSKAKNLLKQQNWVGHFSQIVQSFTANYIMITEHPFLSLDKRLHKSKSKKRL